jgi:hypothetical protein
MASWMGHRMAMEKQESKERFPTNGMVRRFYPANRLGYKKHTEEASHGTTHNRH